MRVEDFTEGIGAEFYTGVPDSLLKPLCDWLMRTYGTDAAHHVVAANEGNAVALAAGYHMATGNVPVVYMQNSGEGNAVNPIASLLNDKVYAIPVMFVVGWRGEPGVHDEPQHVFQGEITVQLLELLDIRTFVVDGETSPAELAQVMSEFKNVLAQGKSVAFVVKKGALVNDHALDYRNDCQMIREEVIRRVVMASGEDPIVSTTGKASRELFEIRESLGQGHGRDFLTVGSMGHASSIALGIALQRPDKRIWCIDGDGATLMHMGALAVNGASQLGNLVHVVINNGAHETVGGVPTVAFNADLAAVARACGYATVTTVESYDELEKALAAAAQQQELTLIEARCALGSREDLGRPTTTALDNKKAFMEGLGIHA